MGFGEEEGRCWIRQPLGVGVASPWLLPVGFWSPLLSLGFPDCTPESCLGLLGRGGVRGL